MILYMGIVLYAPALALEAVTGMHKTVAIILIGDVYARAVPVISELRQMGLNVSVDSKIYHW